MSMAVTLHGVWKHRRDVADLCGISQIRAPTTRYSKRSLVIYLLSELAGVWSTGPEPFYGWMAGVVGCVRISIQDKSAIRPLLNMDVFMLTAFISLDYAGTF